MGEWECRAAGATPQPIRPQPGGFSVFKNSPCMWPESMTGQPGAPLRVHVVDPDVHARAVIAQELMGDSRTVIAGQAATVREGRRLLRDVPFDVLLVDVGAADGAGFELIPQARSLHAGAEVVALSRQESDADAMRAFDLGAAGFVVKDSWFVSFVQAVLQVANGGAAITPALSRRLLLKRRPPPWSSPSPMSQGEALRVKLSMREHEVLRMIASGLTSSEIGDRLAISSTTVNSHVKNMYHKLHVRSRAQAVSCASNWGLL